MWPTHTHTSAAVPTWIGLCRRTLVQIRSKVVEEDAMTSICNDVNQLWWPQLQRVFQWFAARYAETCSKSSFWQQIKLLAANEKKEKWKKKNTKSHLRKKAFFFDDDPPLPKVGGKSLFAGNAGFSICGSKSLKHTLQLRCLSGCHTRAYDIASSSPLPCSSLALARRGFCR